MNYSWLKDYDAEHTAELEPEAAAEAINAVTGTPVSRFVFGSFRTFAALLTDTEYNALRATFKAVVAQEAAAGGCLYGDMEQMLLTPGDEDGNGGGLDLTAVGFVAAMNALCQSEALSAVPGKVASYAAGLQSSTPSLAAEHGFVNGVAPAHVRRVRTPVPEPPVDGGDEPLPPMPPIEE